MFFHAASDAAVLCWIRISWAGLQRNALAHFDSVGQAATHRERMVPRRFRQHVGPETAVTGQFDFGRKLSHPWEFGDNYESWARRYCKPASGLRIVSGVIPFIPCCHRGTYL